MPESRKSLAANIPFSRRKTLNTRIVPLLFALAGLATAVVAEDGPPVVKPGEAAKMVDQQVVVEMEVKSASLREGVCFLNSMENHRDPANFTVFISRDGLARLKERKIEDPAAHFQGKRVRVTGKVTLYREKPQIVVTKGDEIRIVEPQK